MKVRWDKLITKQLIFLCLLSFMFNVSMAEELQILGTVDTKSPRDTFTSFLTLARKAAGTARSARESYFKSSRLYLSDLENSQLELAFSYVEYTKRTLNLSELPEALATKLAMEKILELIEVLGRIDLPKMESIPDIKAMQVHEFKRWNVPGTDITIMRVEKGSRAGEYLFSPETISQLSNFYERVKHLPYKPGAVKNVYKTYRYGGAGLRGIIPLRWMASLPGVFKIIILDQPVWRWIGIILLFLLSITLVTLARRLANLWLEKGDNTKFRKLVARLARPVALTLLIPIMVHILSENLRISEDIFKGVTLILWAIFTLSFAWVIWFGSNVIGEAIVNSQKLLSGSIDSQLILLSLRFFGSFFAIAILVVGTQKLGIPSYSIVAGLGIGGVAVALAARESIANFLGSLLIMFEKPFRVGHWIKIGDSEGIVESVGFRNTRIRTFYNSLLYIPSNTLVNSVVDNMGVRDARRIRTTFFIKYNTEVLKVEKFVSGIKEIILTHEFTKKDKIQAMFNDFGTNGLEILVSFSLLVNDAESEQCERQNIMMAILKLADSIGIEFAQHATKL